MKSLITALLFASALSGAVAQEVTVSGRVLSRHDGKPVEFASVIAVEARRKGRSDENGNYSLTLPAAGEYTLQVRMPGFQVYRAKVNVTATKKFDIALRLTTIKARDITVEGERDIQKVSRYTMTVQDMKSVPAAFNDAVSALTTMPGIIRTNGIFGPLVIRGVDPSANAYFIDDIPILNPLHLFGLHSIIATDLLNEIDVYSSAFPAHFGNALGAVISINTLDDVKEFGGNTDFSIISTNALLKGPLGTGQAVSDNGRAAKVNKLGYWIVSGRYSSFELLNYIPILPQQDVVPKYYDYQVKGKYFLSPDHAVTFLSFGGADRLIFFFTEAQKEELAAEGEDPLLNGIEFKIRNNYHSQALYHTYRPSSRFQNKLMVYSSLTQTFFFIDNPESPDFILDLEVDSRPNVYGVKDRLKWEWLRDHAQIGVGVEVAHAVFTASGQTIVPKDQSVINNPNIDLADSSLFELVPLDEKGENTSYGGYVENKFTFANFTVTPGLRGDYLKLRDQALVDPRGLISYAFPTETTVSFVAGRYSYFLQTNPAWFNFQPEIASSSYVEPEHAIHRSIGLEQKIDLWTGRLEGFYNTYSNLMETDPHTDESGDLRLVRNSGEQENYGIELMVQLDRHDIRRKAALFGWVSYTHTRARRKNNLASDSLGDQFVPYLFEQQHSLKLVGGVTRMGHTVSARFEFYSSFPYTPIVGGTGPDSLGRYVPESGDRNSARFEPTHRLDLRYDYQTNYRWGYVKFYFEVINVTNDRPIVEETWRYDQPYEEGVNPRTKPPESLAIFPNMGVEARF